MVRARFRLANGPTSSTPHATVTPPAWPQTWQPGYDEQIIARPKAEVPAQALLWFPAGGVAEGGDVQKKEPPFPAAFEVDNREASNRVDRSHSVSKQDSSSHRRESLIDRKRTILFRLHSPCRPLAECGLS